MDRTGLRTEVIEGDDALERCAGRWAELFARLERPVPHLMLDYLGACWARQRGYRGGRLIMVTVFDGDTPVLMAPLVRRRELGVFFSLTLLESSTPFYGDVLTRPGAVTDAVWAAFWAVLDGMARVRRLRLNWIRDDAALAAGVRLRRHQPVGQGVAIAYRQAPGADRDYLAFLSSKHRSSFRRMQRRLQEHGELAFERVPPEALPEALAWLFARKAEWVGRKNVVNRWVTAPDTKALFARLAAIFAPRGQLFVDVLRLGGEPVAMVLSFSVGDAVYLSKSTFDVRWAHWSPGDVLHVHAVQQAIAEGANVVDLMIGEYEWKRRLGNEHTGVWHARVPLGRAGGPAA